MCPACMAAAAVTAAKVASLGGLTAFGVKKLLDTRAEPPSPTLPLTTPPVTTPPLSGDPDEPDQDRIPR